MTFPKTFTELRRMRDDLARSEAYLLKEDKRQLQECEVLTMEKQRLRTELNGLTTPTLENGTDYISGTSDLTGIAFSNHRKEILSECTHWSADGHTEYCDFHVMITTKADSDDICAIDLNFTQNENLRELWNALKSDLKTKNVNNVFQCISAFGRLRKFQKQVFRKLYAVEYCFKVLPVQEHLCDEDSPASAGYTIVAFSNSTLENHCELKWTILYDDDNMSLVHSISFVSLPEAETTDLTDIIHGLCGKFFTEEDDREHFDLWLQLIEWVKGA